MICVTDYFQLQYELSIIIYMNRQLITQIAPSEISYSQHTQTFDQQLQQKEDNNQYFGFSGRVFPLLGFLTGAISILWTYYVAVSKSPPDVKPFPWTDITHCGIKFPEYIILRIGLMVAAPLLCISFQILKNYLEIKSFEIQGVPEKSLNSFGWISIIACLLLCLSTSTISDGGDMNWTAHTIGATGFFIFALYLVLKASKLYRTLWSARHNFCPQWSYQIKKYSNFITASILILMASDGLKLIDIGSFVEWYATFYLLGFFLTLFWDLKGMEIVLFKA